MQLVFTTEAIIDRTNEYGKFYRVEGEITGINNKNLAVITIWLQRKAGSKGAIKLKLERKES
ncbi:hypothetical protein [Okeania sp. SIO3B5]|uniref:hypothetical protein n=1 Tax=Okeania sp. SIO3B5 TaxID=2607811 RepID=UPI0025E76273|nr:hypothetical protein [Okeania sp. SIO3B5]